MSAQARERCLNECLKAVADGLELGPGLRRKIWAKGTDWVLEEERLMSLVQLLPVLDPRSVVERLGQTDGSAFLRTEEAKEAVRSWGTARQIPEVLRWFSLAVSAAVRAYHKGALLEPVSVLRSLPVLAMSAVLPWSEELWRDISCILGAKVQDTPHVLRCYRRALQRGDQETLLAVDARVCADPEWGGWARALPDLRDVTLREFSDTNGRVGAPGEASLKGEHGAEVLEFLRLIAHVLRRIPRP